jgi:hypothetical protein
MYLPTSFFPLGSSNATMVENSTIFRTRTFSYNMAYYLIFLAHIPLLKTEKQNALFGPSMILSALF